jgi:hypothetical protein
VVEVPVPIGNKSPEVVDAIDTVVGGLEKDMRDGVGKGCPSMGRKCAWAAAFGE